MQRPESRELGVGDTLEVPELFPFTIDGSSGE